MKIGHNMDKIHLSIVDYCAYDMEPFHLLFSAVTSEKEIPARPEHFVQALIELIEWGYIDTYYYAGKPGSTYLPVKGIKNSDLLSHLNRLIDFGIDSYPDGGEYFFRTTEDAYRYVSDMLDEK